MAYMSTTKVGAAVAVAFAVLSIPGLAQASDHNYGGLGSGYDKVALIRCEASSDGTIKVHSSSVTTATGVTVRRGDKCGATVSALLQAGLRIWKGSRVTAQEGRWTDFNFVFLGGSANDDCDDDLDDDDDDD